LLAVSPEVYISLAIVRSVHKVVEPAGQAKKAVLELAAYIQSRPGLRTERQSGRRLRVAGKLVPRKFLVGVAIHFVPGRIVFVVLGKEGEVPFDELPRAVVK
jgi:hypothetical protein